MVQLNPTAKGIHLRERVAEDHDADHKELVGVPSLLCKFRRVSFIRDKPCWTGLMRERGHLGGRSFTSNGDRRGEPGRPYRQLSERRYSRAWEFP